MAEERRSDEHVVVEEPETTCLLGLLMRDLVGGNLRDAGTAARVATLRGDIQVRAGDMVVTMRFGDGRLTILEGEREGPAARVSGSMPALLKVVTGGGLLGPVLSGAIKVGGNPFLLLRVLPLIRARGEAS